MPNTSPRASVERRTDRVVVGLLLALVAVILAALVLGNARSRVHQVTIENMAYVPATIDVSVGDQVRFTNLDLTPHTVTGSNFDSGAMASGESWTLSVASAENIGYRCIYHPMMKGEVRAAPVRQ